MRVLVLKTSSMGDIIHTLPALTDACRALPGITFDWVVEENFAEIPSWHPAVNKVIPIAWRRWRKHKLAWQTYREFLAFKQNLQATQYDLIIDAQGLIKSAFFAYLARGKRVGFDQRSARESLAAKIYTQGYSVLPGEHAITRLRKLFSLALNYQLPVSIPEYGIDRSQFSDQSSDKPYCIFLHGTTWKTKHWPETHWIALAQKISAAGVNIRLPWGSTSEHERALRIAAAVGEAVEVLPRLSLRQLAEVLAASKAIVAVDTGLGHLAAALDVPTISLYGPTNAVLTGALGRSQIHLTAQFPCVPCLSKECLYLASSPLKSPSPLYPACFTALDADLVWARLSSLL
jgi:heptosyltransferase-1